MDQQQPTRQANLWTHEPLPYRVRLRVALDDDRPGESQEWTGLAYSAMEAGLQAIYEICGKVGADIKYTIERIEPDLAGYLALYALKTKLKEAARG